MDINFSLTKGPSISLTKGKATAVSFAASKGITATVSPVATISVTTISDVNITNAQDNDVLQYNSSSGYWENVQLDLGDDAVLVSDITISNSDAAFSHMTTPITAGTSLEAVLRDMLEKYNVTSISLTNISRAKQNTDGTYPSFSNRTSNETLEVGQGLRVNGFDYNIVDNTQTTDDSVSFFDGGTSVESGFSDDNAAKTLTTVFEEDPSSPTSASFSVKAIDSGGSSNVTISSGSISVNWRYRLRVGASSTESITSNAEAGTLWSGMTLAYNQLRAEQDFSVTASTAMDTAGNYTWIAYPASFGNLSKILLDGSTDVLSDFESPVDYNITNEYSVTTSYRFYRSTFDQAFSSSSPTQVITIEF